MINDDKTAAWKKQGPEVKSVVATHPERSESTKSIFDSLDTPAPRSTSSTDTKIQNIGRYRVEKVLGEGGFGVVYLAYDDELKRRVAIKVPQPRRIRSQRDAEAYLVEAQILARLDHPHIVPVYDVGRSENGLPYVVSKFVEGSDLAAKIKESRLPFQESAILVAKMADALQYAHQHRLVHRDVKPANILLDTRNRPFLVDFGLALKEEDFGKEGGLFGTPAYMSPEQASGEGHLVDGRSDIFSLGVILYELLAGRRPFAAESIDKLLVHIATVDARPLRQIDPAIPQELERITLKSLANRASDRYPTASDFADDLHHWLEPKSVDKQAPASLKIIPKGLRSFDANDADFFLELLPGPRDREGLPDSLRFWKRRIEETDAEKTFRVGVIYGPSGCGKSSLVKAGLLPRLANNVRVVYVEATPDDTETRLLQRLRKACPELQDLPLRDALAQLRRNERKQPKVIIFLDQFEQWLFGKQNRHNAELIQALRQCDGSRVQCIVLVRDDFWLAVSRFMQELELRIVEGENSLLVDLFDQRHARKVLTAFGSAYGTLSANGSLTKEQNAFLDQALAGLSQADKIISVRLALFSEMVKGKVWNPATLKAIGGTAGVGVTFLEETFTASTAPPQQRLHQQAAQAVLKSLLPESGADIKGHLRSQEELLSASGYANRPRDFADLLRILDSEIRLITPSDPESKNDADSSAEKAVSSPATKYYQLTHDYLVPALRDWLTRKQKDTRRGRAELLLADRAAVWNSRPENRQLPSLWQWLQIRTLTTPRTWTQPQRKMMHRAGRVHGVRWGVALAMLLFTGIVVERSVTAQRDFVAAQKLENDRQRATALVEAVLTAPPEALPYAIRNLQPLSQLSLPVLRERFADQKLLPKQRLQAACALADFGEPAIEFLVAAIAAARPADCPNIAIALDQDRQRASDELQSHASRAAASHDYRLKARLAIMALYLDDFTVAADMLQIADRPDPVQRTVFIDEFATWYFDVAKLAPLVANSNDGALRSGIALGLGGIADLDDASKDVWQSVLVDWYTNHPDPVTHSAAGWALRQWKLPEPKLEPAIQPNPDANWLVTKTGLTLVRIPAGKFVRIYDAVRKPEVTLTRDFWLTDREITAGQYSAFANNESYRGPKPAGKGRWLRDKVLGPDRPADQLNWYDAVMFCNWLSVQEQLTPCYELTGENEKLRDDKNPAWRLIATETGYRLPTEAEWEYACRAGTTSEFSSGADFKLVHAYGVIANPTERTELAGSRRCNGWGLFDMHGNVAEWCQDLFGADKSKPETDPTGPRSPADPPSSYQFIRVLRGGSYQTTGAFARSDFSWSGLPTDRKSFIGIRLARTVPRPVPKIDRAVDVAR